VDGPLRGEAPQVCSDVELNRRLRAVFDRATGAERRLLAGISVADLAGGKGKTWGKGRS
jgi:hypothetical protein